MSGVGPLPARLARAARAVAGRRRLAAAPRVRIAEPGADPRPLAAEDPAARALVAAAEALLSAAQRGSRG